MTRGTVVLGTTAYQVHRPVPPNFRANHAATLVSAQDTCHRHQQLRPGVSSIGYRHRYSPACASDRRHGVIASFLVSKRPATAPLEKSSSPVEGSSPLAVAELWRSATCAASKPPGKGNRNDCRHQRADQGDRQDESEIGHHDIDQDGKPGHRAGLFSLRFAAWRVRQRAVSLVGRASAGGRLLRLAPSTIRAAKPDRLAVFRQCVVAPRKICLRLAGCVRLPSPPDSGESRAKGSPRGKKEARRVLNERPPAACQETQRGGVK